MADFGKDPFEEFEFKPINEGLGFHRKNKSQTSSLSTGFDSGFSSQATNQTFNIKSNSTFAAPLPRQSTNTRPNYNIPSVEDDSIAKAQTAVNDILRNLNQKRQLDFVNESEKMNYDFKKSRPLFFAASLDGMLILAAFLMSMIAMLTITKVDLFLNLSHPETSGLIYVATSLLFIAVAFVYMVINRAFLGYTPGEWAFDQRLGKSSEMNSLMYIPRIALRSFLVIATGFITLQLLSYLFNKDVAGQLSGVTLFRKTNA